MQLTSIRYNPSQLLLKDWALIKVTGEDRVSFFQGQVTNDLSKLSMNQGQLTARLNRAGKLQSFFYIAVEKDYLYILCPQELATPIKNDFQKYIIMDDVVLEDQSNELWLRFNPTLLKSHETGPYFDFLFYGLNARLVFNKDATMATTNVEELEKIRILNGWPKWGDDVNDSNFINDSFLNEVAISYNKGCFLGQETVAKIENNRGAVYYPMLLEIENEEDLSAFLKKDFFINEHNDQDDEKKAGNLRYQVGNILQVQLFRDFRVIGRKLNLIFGKKIIPVKVTELPFYKNTTNQELAKELYHQGVDIFQANNLESSMNYMKKALSLDPGLADAYETLGVMLGRIEKYDEAIEWMNQLLIVNPQSVMAHTNKSLFLMKQGKIEEAEAEKSLATIKSFAVFGEEAKIKKAMAEELKKKEDDVLRREKMFLQVLEIDEEDSIALYGMADIFFQRKLFSQAIVNLEKVILHDSKYSTAYLLLGKSYEAEQNIEKAMQIYHAGIQVASKRGDMIPANDMQSRLNQLVVSSRLT
jgi:folate-binding protein YgfZ